MEMFARLRRARDRTQELDARTGYALWADSYPAYPHNALMEIEHRAVLELLPEVRGLRCLDLACGTGRYTLEFLKRGALSVLGLDLSPEMLAGAQKVLRTLVRADLRAVPLRTSSIDMAVCGLAVGHLENLAPALSEISRILILGGTVVYSDFHPFGALLGWKRSFRASNGKEYSIRHYTHCYSEHHSACSAAGLRIDEIREPCIEMDHKWRGFPAAIVIRACKVA